MRYVTVADLAQTLRRTFHKVPHDVDFVAGVPRSGMLPATLIAEWLNAPLIDVDSLVAGALPTGGYRLIHHKDSGRERKRVLVVDDTIFSGGAMRRVREKLQPFKDYDFIYMVVYLEHLCLDVDLWLEDLRDKKGFRYNIFEWNIFHHATYTMARCLYDIDGVFCLDPPPDWQTEAYANYIRNATPLFLPTVEIGEIVSYRLVANEAVTRKWLDEHGVRYKGLTLFPAQTIQERRASGISPAKFKADIYRQRTWAQLFVESSAQQALDIARMTGKPVYCVETNTLL